MRVFFSSIYCDKGKPYQEHFGTVSQKRKYYSTRGVGSGYLIKRFDIVLIKEVYLFNINTKLFTLFLDQQDQIQLKNWKKEEFVQM